MLNFKNLFAKMHLNECSMACIIFIYSFIAMLIINLNPIFRHGILSTMWKESNDGIFILALKTVFKGPN